MDSRSTSPASRTVSLERLAPWVLAAVALVLGFSFGACTQDDAFISFRYAEHLLSGDGLVFNPGERVEGYTNFLWTIILAGFMALGADPVVMSILLGLAALAGLVALTVWLGRGWGARGAVVWVAGGLLAVDASLALEAVEGLETTLYALLLAGGVALGLEASGSRRLAVASGGLLGLAALTRPEAPLVWVVLQVSLLADARLRQGREAFRRRLALVFWAGWPFWGIVLGHLGWRLSYYGAWVPNTFHAKTGGGGVMWLRGLRYLWFHMAGHPLLWALVGLRLLLGRWHRRALVLLALSASYLLYVVAVGGDFKPTGRFIIPVLPFLALLAQEAVQRLGDWLGSVWRALAVLMAVGVGVYGYLGTYRQAARVAEDRHANLEARKLVGDWLAVEFPSTALLAIHSAGAIPYYSGLPTVDMWGLTDARIARVRPEHMGEGIPGHEKTDPRYVFQRHPALYLPEDRVFTLRPWELEVEAGFPDDFLQRYRSVSVPIKGRWLNFWIRRDPGGSGDGT